MLGAGLNQAVRAVEMPGYVAHRPFYGSMNYNIFDGDVVAQQRRAAADKEMQLSGLLKTDISTVATMDSVSMKPGDLPPSLNRLDASLADAKAKTGIQNPAQTPAVKQAAVPGANFMLRPGDDLMG